MLKGNESVLDLGCGDGILTKQIADLVVKGSVLGIDSSDGMISVAKELEAENLSFKKMDIDLLNFKEEYDLIFSNAALHWVKDHRKLLNNCYVALKNNGTIRFNFASHGNCSNFNEVVKKTILDQKYNKYFKTFEWPWYMPMIKDYKEMLVQTEFEEVKIWEENADRYFDNQEELIKWIEQPSIVPFLKLVDEKDKGYFKNEIIQKIINRTLKEDGRCFETFRRINVQAIKRSGNFR